MQVKYRAGGKEDASSPLYRLLPETAETHFAKQMSEIQSEVITHLLHLLHPLCTFIAVSKHLLCLQTKYKKDKEDLSNALFSLLPETLHTQFVKDMAETHSEVRTSRSLLLILTCNSV